MKRDSTVADTLHDLICDRLLIRDMKRCSKIGDTSQLESFHSLLNHYCQKMIYVRYHSMLTRYVDM